MPETIYNLFAYTDGITVSYIGISQYKLADEGSDEAKIEFLQEQAALDYGNAYKARIVSPVLTYQAYLAKQRLGTTLELFEELFQLFKAPPEPLFAMTVVLNGEPRIDHVYKGQLVLNEIEGRDPMIDYLVHYITDKGIDLPQMIEDDYFKAIKLLFNNKHFVSSTKLLMIFIDTISFVEYGDVSGNFISWLNTYTNLESLDITAEELWELRNAILHKSSLDSRKVLSNKVKRLIPSINLDQTQVSVGLNEKCFDLLQLIKAIGVGLEQWLQTYNDNPAKFEKFVERYDEIISDARVAFRDKQQLTQKL